MPNEYKNGVVCLGDRMLSKNFFKLIVACIIYWGPISSSIAKVGLEDVFFSKRTTIKTWVANKYQRDNSLLDLIQSYVGFLVLENTDAFKIQHLTVPQDKDTKRDYGKVFHTLPDFELPFLQRVKKISEEKNIITLEIAAGLGFVSWKVPLAFKHQGHHYANDLSSKALNDVLVPLVTHRYHQLGQPELSKFITAIPGSCFDILEKYPELVNKVDVIYVQNLEHFFNPKQHEKFLKLIETLLAPGGYVFLCAHSPPVPANSYYKLFLEREAKGEIYPGFIQYDVSFVQHVDYTLQIDSKFSNLVIPENYDIECSKKTLSSYKESPYFHVEQRVVSNFYTPKIYRKAIENSTKLLVVDSFYMDLAGHRQTNSD
jgi:SAM-dependent methyltransferase